MIYTIHTKAGEEFEVSAKNLPNAVKSASKKHPRAIIVGVYKKGEE